MLKVIVADDERRIRNIIIGKGEWELLGIEIVGEAVDGDQLFELADALQPDIVLTDMRMPGISGNMLIKKLEDKYKNTKIIIISGYDDFEYMKQAIKSKVVDYILKPIDSQSLNNALRNAIKEIQDEKCKHLNDLALKVQLNEGIQLLNENLLNKFLNGVVISNEEFLNCLGLQDRNVNGVYTSIILKIENFKFVCRDKYKGDYQPLYSEVINTIEGLVYGNGKVFRSIANEYEVIIIFYGLHDKEKLFSFIEDIKDRLENFLGIGIFAGIGRRYEGYLGIRSSFDEARTVLMQMNIIGEKRIAFFEDIASFSMRNRDKLFKNEDVLLTAIENGNLMLIGELIEELYGEIINNGYTSISDIKKLNNDIIFLLEKLIEKADGKIEFLNEIQKLRKDVENEISIPSIIRFIRAFTENVSNYISKKKISSEKRVIYEIKEYIQENYISKISLNELAKKYFWSKQYISKVFKEEFNVNLFDYINTLKIEKAKVFLIKREVKSSEIVEMLGFTDESHFSKVFKKYTGISPKAYKEKCSLILYK